MKRLMQERKTAERKARTKRLIERGAILESLIDGAESMTNEEIKAVLQTALPPVHAAQNPQISAAPLGNGDSLADSVLCLLAQNEWQGSWHASVYYSNQKHDTNILRTFYINPLPCQKQSHFSQVVLLN